MKFIIRNGENRPLASLMEYLARCQVPQEVSVKEYKSKRSLEQNACMWAMYTEVRDWRLEHYGEHIDIDALHWKCKTMFQPIVGSYTIELKIDGILREVEVPIPKGTSKNNVAEQNEYLSKIDAYFTIEQGVKFKDRTYG